MKRSGILRPCLLKGGMLCFMCLLLLFPSSALTGAKNGLLLWSGQVLPSLLPFLIISALFLSSGLSDVVAHRLAPLLSPVFCCSPSGCYAIVIGLLAGLPVGAKTIASLIESGKITKEEGQYLLPLCNNPSPLFILGYVSVSVLDAPNLRYPLLLIITLSSVFAAILLRPRRTASAHVTQKPDNSPKIRFSFSFLLIDAAIEQAFSVLVRVGGYIILFSVLGNLLTLLPLSPVFLACLGSFLEITTGSAAISALSLPPGILISLICGFVAFGGLSTAAQTKSVLAGTNLPFAHYLLTKLVAGILAALSSFLFLSVTA
ncbi:MAG: transporter [Lachnospiraceae bacterium]|nr:transporter [Lachnospiraceae bacterium]